MEPRDDKLHSPSGSMAHGIQCPSLDQAPSSSTAPDDSTGRAQPTSALSDAHPDSIGPYRIAECIGFGGMGLVYLAHQDHPVRRLVALKVIKHGMDTREVVARFESERQALALMDHPHIARVFDAGSTPQGRPYFVMEYVPGIPITEFCDRHRLNNRQRLDVFVSACRAIHHAHQKGVVHRDIKPSNVLALFQDGKAVPKVIDFGVAKAMHQRLSEKTFCTKQGWLVGTPAYMSPEQADPTRSYVDTSSDVYSLGVLLYELLSGTLPFSTKELLDAGWESFQRTIREVEPPRPSTRIAMLGDAAVSIASHRRTDPGSLRRQIRGELDWITMRAMEKNPIQRYASASELADDIERHLRSEPILARPQKTLYQLRKLVARHKVACAFAVTVVTLALVSGIALAITYAGSERHLKRAVRAEAEASQVSAFLVGLFKMSGPEKGKGGIITAREILAEGASKIEQDLQMQPVVRARLQHTMASVYENLGLYPQARSLYERALATRLQVLGENDADVASSLLALGSLLTITGEYTDARPLLERALAVRERRFGPDHLTVAEALQALARLERKLGELEVARPALERALAIREQTLGSEHREVALTLNSLANLWRDLGDLAAARPLYERALTIHEKVDGPEHANTTMSLNNLAALLMDLGDLQGARALYERALSVRERTLGPDHPGTATVLDNLATTLLEMGEVQESIALLQRALAIRRRALGEAHPDVASSLNNLAEGLRKSGDLDAAQRLYEQAGEIFKASFGPDDYRVGIVLHNRASVERERHRPDAAWILYEGAQRLLETQLGGHHPILAANLEEWAVLARSSGDSVRAEQMELRARAIRQASAGPEVATASVLGR